MASCNIKVICRFRPMNAREKQETLQQSDWVLSYIEGHTVDCTHGKMHHNFTFDSVFDPDCSQDTIYNVSARPCIQDVLEGYNGTIFAYGQSGSGKTFTMFGPEKPFPDELKGVIPRASEHIFDHIESDEQMSYAIKCSFLEIYKENIRDLLAPNTSTGINKENIYLKIRESPTKGVWVDGLTEEFATCEQDIDDLIALGDNSRSVASTGMNQRSSRSHTMFVIAIEQKAADGSTKTGRLNLIDLAGSEKIAKTGAKGETLEEAKKINQSLSALGKCINALTTGKGHIPYRESKLTRILQESLGGNTKTTLIVTCSPHAFNAEETVSTMQFGQRAKTIKNKVQVNKQLSVAELEAELKIIQKEYNASKVYSTKLERQISWMRSTDYDPSKPIPADLIATKPAVTPALVSSSSSSSSSSSPVRAGNGKSPSATSTASAIDDSTYDPSDENAFYDSDVGPLPVVDDDESDDGSEAIAIAETKLELQKLRDEIEMNELLIKDEILNMQARLEEKKNILDGQQHELSQADSDFSKVSSELRSLLSQFDGEMAISLEEKKEKEAKFAELQTDVQRLSEETAKLQTTLAESDENFLVLFTENETIRTLLAAQVKELHTTNQSISNISRLTDKLTQKATSSKAEYDMLGTGIEDLEKEITSLEGKSLVLGESHKSASDKIATATAKLAITVQQVAQLESQLQTAQDSICQQKDSLSQSEKMLHEMSTKYHEMITTLRGKLSIAMQNETLLLENWKGQSQKLAEIKISVKNDEASNLSSRQAVESLQNQLLAVQNAIKLSEDDVTVARNQSVSWDKAILTLKAAAKAADLEKRQIIKTQEDLQTSLGSSSGLLATLSHKLNRLQEEKAHLEQEFNNMQQEERACKAQDQNWRTQMHDLETQWKGKELESAKLQNALTKESTRLTTITALGASQSVTIKQQKEHLTQLKASLRSTRESANILQHNVDKLQAKRDEQEKLLSEKEKLRLEAQRNAVEAARLHEQMLQRRRVTNRSSNKKGLLEAFQQKVDIESKRAGLKNTGSLFLQEARDEHYRGFSAQEQKPVVSPRDHASSNSANVLDKGLLGLSPSRSRMSLVRRPSLRVANLDSVRIGGNKLTAAEISLYEQMFSHYDKDTSGSIDANELKALLAELGRQPTDEVMESLMKELDKDGNGLVEFPEFLHGMDILNDLSSPLTSLSPLTSPLPLTSPSPLTS